MKRYNNIDEFFTIQEDDVRAAKRNIIRYGRDGETSPNTTIVPFVGIKVRKQDGSADIAQKNK